MSQLVLKDNDSELQSNVVKLIVSLSVFLNLLVLIIGASAGFLTKSSQETIDKLYQESIQSAFLIDKMSVVLSDLFGDISHLNSKTSEFNSYNDLSEDLSKMSGGKYKLELEEKEAKVDDETMTLEQKLNYITASGKTLQTIVGTYKLKEYFSKWNSSWKHMREWVEERITAKRTSTGELKEIEEEINNLKNQLQTIHKEIVGGIDSELAHSKVVIKNATMILIGIVLIVFIIGVILGKKAIRKSRDILRALEESQKEQKKLASIVESSNDAIIGIGLDLKIISWNRSAEKFFQITKDNAINKSLEIINCKDYQKLSKAIQSNDLTKIQGTSFVFLSAKKIPFEALTLISPIKGLYQKILGYSIILQDVTEKKKFERALELEKEKARKRMEKELQEAQKIQEMLFPLSKFNFLGGEVCGFYKSASECGGDWWHYQDFGDSIQFWIGDATGHGAPSALITSAARSVAFVIEEGHLISPRAALELLNKTIFTLAKGKIMMTMFVASYNKKSKRLTYSNASHNPPLLINYLNKNQSVQDLLPLNEKMGQRLGEGMDARFEEVTIDGIKEGDVLVCFTDGIIEFKNQENKMYGERKFFKSIIKNILENEKNVEQSVQSIYQEFQEFTKNKELSDDVTYFLTRFE